MGSELEPGYLPMLCMGPDRWYCLLLILVFAGGANVSLNLPNQANFRQEGTRLLPHLGLLVLLAQKLLSKWSLQFPRPK